LTTDASFGSEVPVGTAGLIEKFQQGHYAFVAAATASNDSTPQASASGSGKSAASSKNPDDQVNLQVGLPRLERHTTIGGVHLFGGLDVLNANAHLGSQNDDRSQGENVGAVATGIGLEATAEYSGWSLTAGLSASLGASVSSGEERDLDGDGKSERCFKLSFGPLTLGECDEL